MTLGQKVLRGALTALLVANMAMITVSVNAIIMARIALENFHADRISRVFAEAAGLKVAELTRLREWCDGAVGTAYRVVLTGDGGFRMVGTACFDYGEGVDGISIDADETEQDDEKEQT